MAEDPSFAARFRLTFARSNRVIQRAHEDCVAKSDVRQFWRVRIAVMRRGQIRRTKREMAMLIYKGIDPLIAFSCSPGNDLCAYRESRLRPIPR